MFALFPPISSGGKEPLTQFFFHSFHFVDNAFVDYVGKEKEPERGRARGSGGPRFSVLVFDSRLAAPSAAALSSTQLAACAFHRSAFCRLDARLYSSLCRVAPRQFWWTIPQSWLHSCSFSWRRIERRLSPLGFSGIYFCRFLQTFWSGWDGHFHVFRFSVVKIEFCVAKQR